MTALRSKNKQRSTCRVKEMEVARHAGRGIAEHEKMNTALIKSSFFSRTSDQILKKNHRKMAR